MLVLLSRQSSAISHVLLKPLKRTITNERQLEHFKSHLLKHKKLSADKKDLILTILHSTATKREVRNYLSKYPLLKENDIYKNKSELIQSVEKSSKPHPGSTKNIEKFSNKKYERLIDGLLTKYSDKDQINLDFNSNASSSLDPHFSTSNEIQLSDTLRVAFIKITNLNKLTVSITKGIGLTLYKMVQLGVSPVIILDLDYTQHESQTADTKLMMINTIMQYSNTLIQLLETETPLQLRSIRGLFEFDSVTNKYSYSLPELISIPLLQGMIPIIYPIAVNSRTNEEFIMDTADVLKSSAENLTLLNDDYRAKNDSDDLLTIEKIIFIDSNGGIPSLERYQSSHIYINLLQEYDDITSELYIGHLAPALRDAHLKNLKEMNDLLELVPNATGIITTPKIATLKHHIRTTNPIIYNILTDRPTISSSLPVNLKKTPLLNTTIIKRGIPIRIYTSEEFGVDGIDLVKLEERGIVNMAKLKHLIEDSFQKELDLKHYLSRVNGNVAALIIAGEYEGGAIITWEYLNDRKVAYLDKFAVLKKLQGVPGLADIIFKSLLVGFPKELLWRSRVSNPVNKWYFDRSLGNFIVSGANGDERKWRLFWSGEKKRDYNDFKVYDEICKAIIPSLKG
ncbi:hypothetical protein CANARDRAFT_8725 [[Candida] arabinofermentans NRRL YB-2248]|uniref:Amino-acid acetyltransferase, mitochondrial n=1 Tax=[Candida] arabinofermentans NRRL YB-2248 TaxID=983967 RepID=A0A1E4SY07_9ASCO|nr:hypothetical protein CANARDRAFT_8725 [[Candida] arabinofermentans NRRL YB-2248]